MQSMRNLGAANPISFNLERLRRSSLSAYSHSSAHTHCKLINKQHGKVHYSCWERSAAAG